MKKSYVLILGLLMISFLTACGDTSYEPVDISLDSDQCYTCHMGIEDLQSATQVILSDGTPRVFDDIGCMLNYLLETDDDIAVSYVVDHDSGEWIELSEASFVHDEHVQTPMSYGFLAFASEQSAAEYMENNRHGEQLTSDELLSIDSGKLEDWYKGHDGMHHDHENEEE